jgi:hypothetical protein
MILPTAENWKISKAKTGDKSGHASPIHETCTQYCDNNIISLFPFVCVCVCVTFYQNSQIIHRHDFVSFKSQVKTFSKLSPIN